MGPGGMESQRAPNPRTVPDDVLARAYGLALPTSFGGIVVGSLIAGPLVVSVGLTTTLTLAGIFVILIAAMLLGRPLELSVTAGATPTQPV